MFTSGNYGIDIPGAKDLGNKLFVFPHNERGYVYGIKLVNNSSQRCDVELTNNGKNVGTFRLNPYQSWAIKRPANDTGQFTLFPKGSSSAISSGQYQVHDDLNGLIEARFYPDITSTPIQRSPVYDSGFESYSLDGAVPLCGSSIRGISKSISSRGDLSGGVTGLTGHSNQKFNEAEQIQRGTSTIIRIRLGFEDNNYVRPIRSVDDYAAKMPPRF